MADARSVVALFTVVLAAAVPASAAAAEQSVKKSIWGPVERNGVSQFPIYRELGVGLLQTSISWSQVAPTRPANPTDPSDQAYVWPEEVDRAVAEGARNGVAVSILLNGAPGWANGGRESHYAPSDPRDLARFATAAARRYPGVRHWMIWGEPSKAIRFQPLVPALGRRLSARQRRGPRLYARLLDASYGALKRVSRRNLVIGGNTWTAGEVVPLNFIKAMRLPSGRRPRMDLYGHNPFTLRTPRLASRPIEYGHADVSDLDSLASWLDEYGYRDRRGRRLRLFLSELSIPTDHANFEFNFWVTRTTQARWLRAALEIARGWPRIYTLGYLGLYDDPPRPDGLEVNRGLLTFDGTRKPGFHAFGDG